MKPGRYFLTARPRKEVSKKQMIRLTLIPLSALLAFVVKAYVFLLIGGYCLICYIFAQISKSTKTTLKGE
ncbi:MAG TPA: hypothetical protein VMW41_04255 [Candidatus Bathyarchaeia archaeon]|nr:hypothetical protein [Candidatus Bathyarchaeia archaeon]